MKTTCITRICWSGDDCIGLACRDLAEDFFRTGNARPQVEHRLCTGAGILTVGTLQSPDARALLCPWFDTLPTAWEEYVLCIRSDRILILGTDKRAAMWGVYHISRLLGVPEAIRFLETPPAPCATLPEGCFGGRPATFRFRGWFINDEDLLCRWHDSGATRHMDYPYYHHITDVTSMEPVVETALRMGINLMIPASFLDIDDPAQQALAALCTRRGLYISQHHIEPLGVSHFTWKDHCLKQGYPADAIPAFSFVTEREKTVAIWRHYAQKWAEHGDVLWQLGLRGKADRPVWYNDASPHSRAEWGAVISDAIRTQYDIVREVSGENAVTTCTLWMEGSALYREGLLQLPEDTILIFSDTGPTQMLSADFYVTPHTGRPGGLYYHAAYWGDGPHLAMGTDPQKMLYNYQQVIRSGCTAYSILNVSNVREHLPVIAANAQLVWDSERFDPDAFVRDWCTRCYGCSEAAALFPAYFAAFIPGDRDHLEKSYGEYFDFYYCATPFPYYPLNDGAIRLIGLAALNRSPDAIRWIDPLEESIARFTQVVHDGNALQANRDLRWLLFGARYMIRLSRWALNCCRWAADGASCHLDDAAGELRAYLEEREEFAVGRFANWYRSDEKTDAPGLLRATLRSVTAAR
jgi:hypothetical protein